MPPVRELYVVLGAACLAACAQAGESGRGADPDASVVRNDSNGGGGSDSSVIGTDSSTGCTTMTTNVLANGNFDGGATGWTVTPILSGDPIINTKNADGGAVDAQSPTYRAWMGGVEAAPASNKDAMYQDVLIPQGTTALEFAGYYDVRTGEPGGAYDKGDVEIVTTNGTQQLDLIKHLDNTNKTTSWTAFNKTITTNFAGQTVRLRFTTAGDGLYATSFFFDSVALNATYCQ
jgi:hypothetical protein